MVGDRGWRWLALMGDRYRWVMGVGECEKRIHVRTKWRYDFDILKKILILFFAVSSFLLFTALP